MLNKNILAAIFIFGCSSKPKILPKNEINEPVFHKTHFSGLGTGFGKQWTRNVQDGRGGYLVGSYADPRLYFERNVSSWAGYNLWPILWNFLLTGEQYVDSSSLKVMKLNIAAHGGVSGISYSQRSGWVMTGLMSLTGKYLINEHWFIGSDLGIDFYNLENMASSISHLEIDMGRQLSARNSLKLTYNIGHYSIPEDTQVPERDFYYLDGDNRTEVILRHSYYANRKHIFGPQVELNFKNHNIPRNHSLQIGAHYRFLFD